MSAVAVSTDFPAFFFHAEHGRKKVFSQEDRDALGPEWSDSPATVHETLAAAKLNAPPAPPVVVHALDPDGNASTATAETGPVSQDPAVPATAEDQASLDEAEKTALWSAPVGVIVESLEGASLEILERMKGFEELNPKGARVTVIRAADKAIETLLESLTQPPTQ
jgi:hypothetical protein